MKTMSTITCIFLLLTAASRAAPPDWFVSGQHPGYQTEFYFVGVGSGDSYEAAARQASAQIARQIEVRIESESAGFISSYADDDRETIRSQYESITRSFSNASLQNAEISEKAVADNTYYVLMTIDKEKYAAGLRVELDRMRSEINRQYKNAELLIDEGKILPAFQTLIETGDAAAEFHARSVLYASITGSPYLTDDIISAPALLTEVRKLIGRISLEKISGDRQTAQNGRLLTEPLTVKAVIRRDTAAIPLTGLRLALKDEDNRLVERQHTDNHGLARFWVYAAGEERGKVTVGIDPGRIPAVLKRDFGEVQTTFHYNITAIAPMTFTVRVRDKEGKRLKSVEDIVSKSVQQAGHHVSDEAVFMLSGVVSQVDAQQVEALDGRKYLVKSELVLFISDKQSGEKVGSLTIKGTGMHSESERKALEESYGKLKPSRKELTRALSVGADRLKPIQARTSKEALARGKACYDKGMYQEALGDLARVTTGDKCVAEAEKLIEEIKLRLLERQKSAIPDDK